MAKALFKSLNPWSRLIILLVMVLVSAVIIGLVTTVAVIGIYNLNMDQISGMANNLTPDLVEPLLILNTLIIQVGMFIVPALLFIYFFGKNSVNGYWFRPVGWKILLVPVIMISALPIIEILVLLNEWLIPEGSWMESQFKPAEEKAAELTEALMVMPTWGVFLRNVFLVALLPAIGEEIAFRGILQSQLAKITKNIHLSIWISAFLFSAIHFQFYGFLPRMFLGAIMGYLLIWTGSIWAPILAHFTNNFMATSISWYAQKNQINPDEIGELTLDQWPYFLLGTVFFLLLIIRFQLSSKWKKIEEEYIGEKPEIDEEWRSSVID